MEIFMAKNIENKKYLITSALPYVNGIPHLGHMVGCLLPSDVYARFCRNKDRETLYILGTDEYGTPTEVGALKEGMDVKEYCDKYFSIHKETYEKFDLSMDRLGRTTNEKHIKLVQDVFNELNKNGFISEKEIEQIYSIDDDMFLADRYVEGTCPKCGYEKARGDQCDGCGSLLNPTDLKDAYSTVSGSKNLEVRKTKHLFLKLSNMQKSVESWLDTRDGWSKTALSIAHKWLKEGLHDRCITRDLKWGVPVPLEGYENKVFYVWFDAPWGYVSISQEWAENTQDKDKWNDFWLPENEEDVKYIQFMGKDNVPFHSVFFPAEEISTDKKWKTTDIIKASNFLNFKDGKFSKSLGNGFSALDSIDQFPSDYWRYWLMANYPENDDTSFSFEKFSSDINSDLNNVLGNFVSRVIKFSLKNFSDYDEDIIELDFSEWDNRLEKLVWEFDNLMDSLEFRKSMGKLREIWVLGNEFLENYEPWKVAKEDKAKAHAIMLKAINYVYLYALISNSIIPNTSNKILELLGKNKEDIKFPVESGIFNKEILFNIKSFKGINNIEEMLFSKVDNDKVEELSEKYKS
ncbi:MAG: methionine--tRNA ligase [Alphaproteobacteria bacterium]|nr:methionine--tRNA ligase [Alphaproteobacteria bacterium]